ncbi:radical SAM protein [uncultured Treponema sp.]|uniref:radical SAM protein n=1 Tax=uncultured Treponema sp. TaxID=162155 RepID=UPI0025E9BB00|nr:radical SAM protein [uncultured Treponema sp.]
MESLYENCRQCPRNCGINRTSSVGFCKEPSQIRIAVACLHFGEEPLITVHGGSGTIFLTGCNLRCAFCQNYQISQQGMGAAVSKEEFAEICLKLEEAGAENINLVTGSHHIPALAEGLAEAKKRGLTLPVCWNSSGYDSVESLKLLEGLVTIWLPDLKTLSSELSNSLCAAADYPEKAKEAVKWMIEHNPLKLTQVSKEIDGKTVVKDKILQGVIVRHLFLPGRFFETADVLEWLKQNADGKAIISLMSQYTPVPFKDSEENLLKRKKSLSVIENRLVSQSEDTDLRDLIEAYDFDYLFYQDLCADTEWLPDFEKKQPFSYKLAKPIWHWKFGWC